MNNNMLIITGPTGVGKTELSIRLAKSLNGEIISADSMQIYKLMDIGSAKISKDEMQGVPHHMIDIISPEEPFTVSDYKQRATEIINEVLSRNKYPILVGGTGLYIDSIICNLNFTEGDKDPEYRTYLENLAQEKGNLFLHNMLREIDLESYERIHPNNVKRVIRALEVHKLTGKTFSSFEDKYNYYNIPYNINYYVLTMNRAKLYDRINKRVDIMLEKGLIQEVKNLKELGFASEMQSMQGIGYKEILYYLENKMTLEAAIDKIKQGSRNYAKRQLTWFRKDPRAKFIDKDTFESEDDIVQHIIDDINNL